MILDLSDMEQHSFDIAQRFFTAKFPDAECAFVAGSLMRGEGKPHSDIDLVVLYGPDFMAVRREGIAPAFVEICWQASLVEQPTLPGLGLQYCCSSCA